MTLVQERPKTKQALIVEMSTYLNRYLDTLPPKEAAARLRAAEKALAKAKSARRSRTAAPAAHR